MPKFNSREDAELWLAEAIANKEALGLKWAEGMTGIGVDDQRKKYFVSQNARGHCALGCYYAEKPYDPNQSIWDGYIAFANDGAVQQENTLNAEVGGAFRAYNLDD